MRAPDVAAYANNLNTDQPPEPIAFSVAVEAVESRYRPCAGLLARNRASLCLQNRLLGVRLSC